LVDDRFFSPTSNASAESQKTCRPRALSLRSRYKLDKTDAAYRRSLSNWLINRDSERNYTGDSPKSGEQEKLLRLQDLRNSLSDLWITHLLLHLEAENRFCKQSLPITSETARISNRNQYHTVDRQLQRHHIHLIALGSTIGTGFFLSPATTSGPLPLLMALTLIALIAWPVMYCLGELVASCPMSIKDSWIHDVILYQKLLRVMILLGAVYPQIMSVVAGILFPSDEELGYVFALSCTAFGIGLYYTPNILKKLSSTIFAIWLLVQTFTERCTNSLLGHRSSWSRSHAGQALIMSLLLWTSPVTATAPSHSTNTPSPYSSFLLALSIESGKLFSVSPLSPFPPPHLHLTSPANQTKPNKTKLTKTNPALHNPPTTLPPHLPPTNPPPRPPPHHLLNHPPLHLSRTQQHFNEIPALYQRLSRVNPRLRLRSRCGRSRVPVSVSRGFCCFNDFRYHQCNLTATASFRGRARKESP
jgi:hypothetical protein